MGVLKAAYEIIQKWRMEGKSEREIADIIEKASDKATVRNPAIKDRKQKQRVLGRENRKTTNNWRKMHGLPMKRGNRNGRKRKTNGDSNDTDIS
jgi:hypothetical protein